MMTLIEKEYPRLEAFYLRLHAHPELSLQEKNTSSEMAKALGEMGIKVTQGVGGYGVVGILENGRGPTLMIRADMDALPIQEATGLSYASRVAGVMHACGHDIHMTCLLGTARVLAETKNSWNGTIVFVLQPAEEKGQGAKSMIDDGLFKRFPRPDFALALHVDSQSLAGRVGYRTGYAFANVDSVDIVVYGQGGHGAYPHLTVDPVVMASEMVVALQTIRSRNIKPYESAVITVGSIHGGTKHNIIPDQIKLELTVRSYTDEVRDKILEGIQRIASGIARVHGAPKDPDIRVTESIPSTYNDPQLVARLVPVFKKELGEENVTEKDPEMGGEDFGLFGRAGVSSCLFRIGSVAAGTPPPFPSLHSSTYAPNAQATIQTGVRAMTAAALELLGKYA